MSKNFKPITHEQKRKIIIRRIESEVQKQCEESTPELKKGIEEILKEYEEEGIDLNVKRQRPLSFEEYMQQNNIKKI